MTGEWFPQRAGMGLLEAVVALVLTALLAAIVAATVRGGAVAARHAGGTADAADAVRTAAVLLSAELRALEPAADLAAAAADSIRMRAFRGSAIVCDTAAGHLVVRYRGLRAPDPTKDSLVLLGPFAEQTVALAAVSSGGGCAAAAGEQVLRLQAVPAPHSRTEQVLIFEAGSYHLAGGALRYRRGSGGRQPMTPDVLANGATAFGLPAAGDPLAPRGLAVTLVPAPLANGSSGTAPPLAPIGVDLAFLNRPAAPDTLPERP